MLRPVTLGMIGLGGLAEDQPLVAQIEEAIQRLAMIVHEPDRGDEAKGVITVKITVQADEAPGIIISSSVAVREPPRAVRALSAVVRPNGEVLTAGAQGALDLAEEA
jgi:hypothetical protein